MSTYFSIKALVSQRSSGYKNTTYALSELIDNSFDAGATNCKIVFIEKRDHNNRKYIDEIIITDDGEGMTEEVLKVCLQFGGGTNDDLDVILETKKIGKFGYGLPNASLSQCPNITVASWKKRDEVYSTKLNLEELKGSQSIDLPEIESFHFPAYYEKLNVVLNTNHGTVVSWKDCDRLSNSRAQTIIEKSEKVLGKLFRYLLEKGKKIELAHYEHSKSSNDYIKQSSMYVRKNDPLFLMSDTVIATPLDIESDKQNGAEPDKNPATYYSKFSISKKKCKPTNRKLDDQSYTYKFEWKGKLYEFEITTSVAANDIQKPGIREGGDTPIGKFYKEKEKECISFIRADREISAGNYGFYNQSDPRQRWWSIQVAFSPDSDELLGVHNNKQGIEFTHTDDVDPTEIFDKHTATLQQAREQLWSELTKKLALARKEAWKAVLEAHKKFELEHPDNPDDGKPVIPGATEDTLKIIDDTEGQRSSQFTDEEKEALFARLKEKYAHIPDEDILRTIELYDKAKLRGCVLYSKSDSERLWSLTNVGNFLIVLINTNHLYYQNVIHPIRIDGQDSALTAIELFISSLAWEEHTHFAGGLKKDTIEEYRSFVGIHLNSYLREYTYKSQTNTGLELLK